MTANEIDVKIKQLKEQQFYLNMKDHWDSADYDTDRELTNRIKELERQKAEKQNG